MKVFSVKYDKDKKSWFVKTPSFFNSTRYFKERQKAINFVKEKASDRKNRPSKVNLFGPQGSILMSWEYKAAPKKKYPPYK